MFNFFVYVFAENFEISMEMQAREKETERKDKLIFT
jgi:hypothetical protein